jgi:hypothetical protein
MGRRAARREELDGIPGVLGIEAESHDITEHRYEVYPDNHPYLRIVLIAGAGPTLAAGLSQAQCQQLEREYARLQQKKQNGTATPADKRRMKTRPIFIAAKRGGPGKEARHESYRSRHCRRWNPTHRV